MSAEDKAPYKEMANVDKTRHKEEMTVYDEGRAPSAATTVHENDSVDGTIDSEVKTLADGTLNISHPKAMTSRVFVPKRAMSAYICFGCDMRATLKAENPAITSKETMTEIGKYLST